MIDINDVFEKLKKHSEDNLGEAYSNEAVLKAETKLGITFPESYRKFLLEVGYAEIFGDEIYSIYDIADGVDCLGIVQQNKNKKHFNINL